jgi:methionyl-tRNA formyltransferase
VVWAWCAAGHDVVEIWTDANPSHYGAWKRDRRLGRLAARWSLTAAIKKNQIPHRRIESLKDTQKFADLIESLKVDVILSVHFARILPSALLSRLTMPVLNLHPSLLPAYRGATPLVSMVVDDAQGSFSGVTLHQIVPAIDAGPIFASCKVPFPKNKNMRKWELDLARAGSELVLKTVPGIVKGDVIGSEQSEEMASYQNTVPDDLKVTPAYSAAKVTRLCETLGRARPLVIDVGGRDYQVTQIARKLGPPTGQSPRVGWLYIDADVSDARVRLRRKPSWEGRRRRVETRLLYMFSR